MAIDRSIGRRRGGASKPQPAAPRRLSDRAFNDLLRQHEPDLRRYVRRRVCSADLAEDITQDALLCAYRSRQRFDADRAMWPWLMTIAQHLVVNAIRDTYRHERVCRDPSEVRLIEDRPDPGPEAEPENAFVARQRREAIMAALGELPIRHRRLLIARVVKDMTYAELASEENLSVDAVKSALKRARERFRVVYRDIARECGIELTIWPALLIAWAWGKEVGWRVRIRYATWELDGLPALESVGAAAAAAAVATAMFVSSPDVVGPDRTAASAMVAVSRSIAPAEPAVHTSPIAGVRGLGGPPAAPPRTVAATSVEPQIERGRDRASLRLEIQHTTPTEDDQYVGVRVDVRCTEGPSEVACRLAGGDG